jgi:hypothetical protein
MSPCLEGCPLVASPTNESCNKEETNKKLILRIYTLIQSKSNLNYFFKKKKTIKQNKVQTPNSQSE